MVMQGHFGADVNLPKPGKYTFKAEIESGRKKGNATFSLYVEVGRTDGRGRAARFRAPSLPAQH